MNTRHTISRKDFLHGIFHSFSRNGETSEVKHAADDASPEPDYLSMLPPEFSGPMLDMEAARLGGDAAGMSRNAKAALVIRAMYGEDALHFPGRRTPGSAQEKERQPLD